MRFASRPEHLVWLDENKRRTTEVARQWLLLPGPELATDLLEPLFGYPLRV